jgi:hypothetical protein
MNAIRATFALAFVLLLIPDCCLSGRHDHGAGMAAFGQICRALR